MNQLPRIVITGIGLTAPNGNQLDEYRNNILAGKSGVTTIDTHYMGELIAGCCDFDTFQYQKKKEVRRGTRAGSISIFCANEAIKNATIQFENIDKSRVGVYIGITEHGNVETENEIYNISQFGYDTKFWSHHHNPRTVANSPAGEVTLNLGITGPHYCLGAACAAGNIGLIQGAQMLQLGEVDLALAGGVSESVHTFGIFAAFKSQGALAENDDPEKASRPFDVDRNGIVVSEGGCIYTLERLDDALKRNAHIYGEIVGHAINSDATDFVLPNPKRQGECVQLALNKAGLTPNDINIVNTHATSTPQGDIQECEMIRKIFGNSPNTFINNTKSFIGHCMGAAGTLELAGNLPSFEDNLVHQTINVDNLDPACNIQNLVINEPRKVDSVNYILNNSFGMVGINSVLIIKNYKE
ncbi:MAG: beta-ketoacyl-[acyl-carrier-protein] synthase family protein [Pseudomonadales bacterium]|nr:beta-ketoacyl-[acyl-carrier-protein] synthase family protein [Pseudomonadales bacterium]PCJ62268.1 MAG: beta-ketoacyl synthase [Planctomycetota bacterium]